MQLRDFVYLLFGTLSVSFGTSAVPSLATACCTADKHSQDSYAFLILCLQFLHVGPALCCWSAAKATASELPFPDDV